ncbi:GntR family transcriptional regulator [Consotaella salsifontis]|uniref:Transcriptional regulator, GntR family n=1 Tax=Consotaella salsifontis TaxID=1365950 RepID=A0A1T4MJR8_9HYPH|nr:GntR family transcriptional regulator [Consotaella salsifontis]SJZ66998.1 transcriptional regulator, GntR family [Consotaella salsifontis]
MSLDVLSPIAGTDTRGTAGDAVFEEMRRAILECQLQPGARVSEADVARRLGVSRQPVRDAFGRLARAGYLRIQPQRATEVTKISMREVYNARFIREALEVATVRRACDVASQDLFERLAENLAQQYDARQRDDRELFHQLDDQFHMTIAEGAGCGFVWHLIEEQKAQMDRVRFLSLSFGQMAVYDEHLVIVEALKGRDKAAAEAAMRNHLAAIFGILKKLQSEFAPFFEDAEA